MGAFQLVVTSTNLAAIPDTDTPLLAFKFRSVLWRRQRKGRARAEVDDDSLLCSPRVIDPSQQPAIRTASKS
jgi:hypothetical protein